MSCPFTCESLVCGGPRHHPTRMPIDTHDKAVIGLFLPCGGWHRKNIQGHASHYPWWYWRHSDRPLQLPVWRLGCLANCTPACCSPGCPCSVKNRRELITPFHFLEKALIPDVTRYSVMGIHHQFGVHLWDTEQLTMIEASFMESHICGSVFRSVLVYFHPPWSPVI